MTTVPEVVRAVHAALDDAGVPHAFGGAIALAYAVPEPRGTIDVDVNVFVRSAEARRAFAVLPAGVAWDDADVERVERDGQVRVWWDEVPLDLFFDYHRLHEEAATGAVHVPFGDTTIRVLAPDHLAVFKAFSDRTKDWADLEAMAECGSFDADAVLGWLERLLGTDEPRLARLRAIVDAAGQPAGPPPQLPR